MAALGRSDKCRKGSSWSRSSSSSSTMGQRFTEVVSVRRRTEENGKVSFSVECSVPGSSQVTRSKKFEEPDARWRALRFGFFTEGLVDFRNFLFGQTSEGLGKGSEGLGDIGSLTVCVRRSHISGLLFAAAVFMAGKGTVRGVSFGGEEGRLIEKALAFLKGENFRVWARRVVEQEVQGSSPLGGEACRLCRQQEKEEEKENNDAQISEDCICIVCKACKEMERGTITVITMDDQGEYRTVPADEIGADNKRLELTGGEPVCTICGCEDNEKFEKTIAPCSCNENAVVVHPNCFRAFQAVFKTGSNHALALCKVCYGRGATVGFDDKISTGLTVEGFSKLVGLNSSRNTMNTSSKKGAKPSFTDMSNGGTETAELFENQPALKRLKGESGRKAAADPHKEDSPNSESEKTGVARHVHVSVPIKKRKFWPPSAPQASLEAPSSLDSSYPDPPVSVNQSDRLPDPPVSLNQSDRLPDPEEEQGELKGCRDLQSPDNIYTVKGSVREKSVKIMGDTSGENREKVLGSVSNADVSGVSTVDTSMVIPGKNSSEKKESRGGYMDLEDANPVAVSLKDNDTDGHETPRQDYAYEGTRNQEEQRERQVLMQESTLLPASTIKSYVCKGSDNLNEKEDNVVCKQMKEVTKLALGCNRNLGSSGHSEIGDCSKVTSEVGECSQHKSTSLLNDGDRQEKGMLLRLNSGYFDDDRSHWDLNAPMDSWEEQVEASNRGYKPEFAGKLPAAISSGKSSECSVGIQVQILDLDARHNNRKPEQDMLSKGLQADDDDHAPKSSGGLALDKDPVLNMSLGLQSDAKVGHHSANSQNNSKGLFVAKRFALLDTSVAERDLNLSMAQSEVPCELADDISSTEAPNIRHSVVNPIAVISEKEAPMHNDKQRDSMMIDVNSDTLDRTEHPSILQSDKQLDTTVIDVNADTLDESKHPSLVQSDKQLDKTVIDVNADTFDETRQSDKQETMIIDVNADKVDRNKVPSPPKFAPEPLEDIIKASDLASAKDNLRGPNTSNEFPDCEQKYSPSISEGKQGTNETINENRAVSNMQVSAISEVDMSAENVDNPGEKSGSPDVVLDKQSTDDAKEIAYGGDYESDGYDDEDEPVSDTEREFVERAEDEHQDEEGEYIETDLHDWIEEDVGEELEDEHVDYGDSDFKDVDDPGMEQDDKGKDVEHNRNWDDSQKSEMEGKCYNLQVKSDAEDMKLDMTAAGTGSEHSTEKEKHKTDGTESQSPELSSDKKGLEIEPNCNLDKNKEFSKSREVIRLSASLRPKSSGWDQLPDGCKSTEEALKAVQDIISKRGGRGSSWTSGGRLGPMSARIPSSRVDGAFRERMISDDSIHGKEGFFISGRDGSLSTSPSFASRKPTRGRIAGRGGPSRGIHHRGRSDPWADGASSHWASSRHHSPPDYYGNKVGFGSHGSANAAAVSAAKVESSGFVVARDGTLTKITRGGIRGRRGRGTLMGRGSAMEIEDSLDFERQMSMGSGGTVPDAGLNASRGRAIALGPDRIDGSGHVSRERYRGPSFGHSRWDHSAGDSPRNSMDHRLRERNRSFSPPPGRRVSRMSRSHTQSRSRSRTRSPRLRPSPRGSSGASMGRGPAIRRRSRSPHVIRSEARIDRPKSPLYHRVGSFEHKMSFLSSPRTQRPSPRSSKWSYDRRDPDHFRNSDYKRYFVRSGSPSRRMSPRAVHESGLTDSPGRLRHSEYRGSLYPSRTSELSNESRRFKRDESEDVGVRQSDISGRAVEGSSVDIRRFRHHDDEGDCQARSSCVKDAGISREQGMEEHEKRS